MFSIGSHTFPDLHVSSAVLTTVASGTDTLEIGLSKPIDATAAFSPWQQVTLYQDSSPIWVGWLDMRALTATGANQATSLTFRGAARWLDLICYRQSRSAIDSFHSLGSVVLGLGYNEDDEPVKISANAQAAQIAAQLAADTPAYPAPGGVALRPNFGGAYLPALKLPLLPKTNSSLGTCLLALIAWFPRFCFRSAPLENLPWDEIRPQLDLVDTDSEPTITISTAAGIADLRITPRYDLQLSQTTIHYVRRGSEKGDIFGVTTDTASTTNGSPNRLTYTIDLEPGEAVPDAGLAAEYQLWAGRLLWDTSLTIPRIDWAWLPGHRIAFDAPLPTAIAVPPVIQTITRDLFSQTTQITAGTRGQLGLDQRIELARKHPRSAAAGIGEQAFDGGDATTEQKNKDGELTVAITTASGYTYTVDPNAVAWTAPPYSGTGEGTTKAVPGTYTVLASPTIAPEAGIIFTAPPASATAAGVGSTPAALEFTPLSRLQLIHSDGRTVDIDTSTLPTGATAQFREITVCTTDGEQTAWVLMTEPTAPTP